MGDGFQFFIKIKATVTTDKVDEANGVCKESSLLSREIHQLAT